MHPETESILAFRDGEAPLDVARHVASCPECSAEVERLRDLRDALRSLPIQRPERDLWPRTAERIEERQRRSSAWLWAAAAAAVLVVAAGVADLRWRQSPQVPSGPVQVAKAAPAPSTALAPVFSPAPATVPEAAPAAAKKPRPAAARPKVPAGGRHTEPPQDPEVARLIRESQDLEGFLSTLEDDPVVVSGRRVAAEMGIRERLLSVDASLGEASPASSGRPVQRDLWQERVKLLSDLAEVKGAKKKVGSI